MNPYRSHLHDAQSPVIAIGPDVCHLAKSDDSDRNYRFYFFSREESRMHVHLISPDGEAKFQLEPKIEPAVNKGLGATELNELEQIVEERQNKIRNSWQRHFKS